MSRWIAIAPCPHDKLSIEETWEGKTRTWKATCADCGLPVELGAEVRLEWQGPYSPHVAIPLPWVGP